MAKSQLTRTEIPQSLFAAKKSAAATFLSSEPVVMASALAARSDPKHNVVGVGLGRKMVRGKPTKELCVRFYVERKLPKAGLSQQHLLPSRINGVKTDVIESGLFRAFADPPREQTRIRPARPGCSVGFAFTGAQANFVMAGTFGAVVEAQGTRFILSNNHVLAQENSLPPGSTIFQPGLLDMNTPAPNAIATMTRFITLSSAAANKVDCAIAEITDPAKVSATVMPKVGKLGSNQPLAAAMSMKVMKTGRTTGFTTGVITDLTADVKVKYEMGTLSFTDQIIIHGGNTPFSDSGDSGSLIVEQSSKRAVGLLFAGSTDFTIANHIEDVLGELQVNLVA
jgi:hypothetical protein